MKNDVRICHLRWYLSPKSGGLFHGLTCPSKKKRSNSDTTTTIDPDSHIQAAETLVNLSQPSSSSTKCEHEATTEAPAAATPIKIKLKRHLCKARPPAQPQGSTVTCKHKFFFPLVQKGNLSNGKLSLMKLRKMKKKLFHVHRGYQDSNARINL